MNLIIGGIKHMAKLFKRVGYGSLVGAFVATLGCSTTKENQPNSAKATNPAPNSQIQSSGPKSQALSDKNLRGGQDQSSLDALRR